MSQTEDAAVRERIRHLHWRTIGVGWVATLVVLAGLVATILCLGALRDLVFGQGDMGGVAFHLPSTLRHASGLPLLSMIFVGMAGVGAWGLSTGRLRRSHSQAAFAMCLVAGLADFFLAAPLHQPLFALPSHLEKLVARGAYAQADRLLTAPGDGSMRLRQEYVRAQIALRAGDTQRLEQFGRPLLRSADDYAYAGSVEPAAAEVYRESMGDLRLEVLAAIDRKLNRTPLSVASIESTATASSSPVTHRVRGPHTIGLVAIAIALALTGLLLSVLWRRMRANVLRIIDLADG